MIKLCTFIQSKTYCFVIKILITFNVLMLILLDLCIPLAMISVCCV